MPQHFTLTPADGSDALAITVPTSWADVALDTFLSLQAAGLGEPELLALLLDLDVATVERISANDAAYLINCLGFVMDASELYERPHAPDLPYIGPSPYGLLAVAQQHVQALPEGSPALAAAPFLYALYRSHQIYGKVDDAKLEAMRLAVLAAPVTEVFADVAFFLQSYRRATSGISQSQKTLSSPKKKNTKRGWKSWVRDLVSSSPSTARPKASG
jgi:hypothetical protein